MNPILVTILIILAILALLALGIWLAALIIGFRQYRRVMQTIERDFPQLGRQG